MQHLIQAAKREAVMRRRVFHRQVDQGLKTQPEADRLIAEMDDIAALLADFHERILPLSDFVRRIHPDIKDEENLLTIPAEPRLNLTVGQLRAIVGLYARNTVQGELL